MALWIEVALIVFLVLVNAAFAGSEIALVTLREGQLGKLEERDESGRSGTMLAREPDRFLATVQIGITLAGVLASATAAVSLAEPLVEPLGFLGDLAEPTAILLVTSALTFVTLVVGDLAPKRLAMQRAEGWALASARPLMALSTLTKPIVWLLGKVTDLTVRIPLGIDGR